MFKFVSSKNFTNTKTNILKNTNKIRDENNIYYNLNKEEKELM